MKIVLTLALLFSIAFAATFSNSFKFVFVKQYVTPETCKMWKGEYREYKRYDKVQKKYLQIYSCKLINN